MRNLDVFLNKIDAMSKWSGKGAAFLIFVGIFVLVWEVVMRYLFHRPTMWAHGISQRLFAVYYILAGAYVLQQRAHVTVDILYNRLPPRTKSLLSLIVSSCFFTFCGVLLWKGIDFAWTSLAQWEPDETPWRAPIYPAKLAVPVGAFLILVQGLANFIRDLMAAVTGREHGD